jgi:hypothetical protein
MKQKLLFVSALFLVLMSQYSQAQDSVVASGGDATGSGGTVSYSVGQVVYASASSSSGSLSLGVQHAFEISSLSNLGFTALSLSAVVYPNPASDRIVLYLRDSALTDLSYVLYDLSGKGLSSGLVQKSETAIALQNVESGVYILKVNQNSIELKTFKIIKK